MDRVERVLREQLAEFLAQPADEREPTGSETQPGIYADTLFGASLGWVAWDYDPRTLGSDSPEVIEVTESELTGEVIKVPDNITILTVRQAR